MNPNLIPLGGGGGNMDTTGMQLNTRVGNKNNQGGSENISNLLNQDTKTNSAPLMLEDKKPDCSSISQGPQLPNINN